MQRFIITSLLVLSSFVLFANTNDQLILAKAEDVSHLYSLFENQDLKIHYYSDSFIIASLKEGKTIEQESIILDEAAFSDVKGYYIVYCEPSQRQSYLTEVQHAGKVLYSDDNLLIMKPLDDKNKLFPAKNDGMVYIPQRQSSLPKRTVDYPVVTEIDPLVQNLMEMVNTDSIMVNVQHLQDYGTRRCDHANSVLAQDWLKEKYENLDMDVELQNFSAYPWWGGTCVSGNVIAVQQGTLYPDEYIVCGAHYDSFAYMSSQEPGADDNATGIAGILEIARILSQYEFQRSIIYCSFTAEECGLNGSDAYASRCKQQGMDILGYFNIDMSGYLKPGSEMHIDLIHPTSATPLATYYTNIASVYFPSLPVTSYPNLPGGDSDHTSFNQNGYQGIFPFEDRNDCSPYIHSSDDIIGPSVNTPEQCRVFTQITFASMVTLAGLLYETPLPVTAFSASETIIMEGDTVQFTDLSTNDPTEWHWYFEGGTPEESTEQHPEVLYETPGSYAVKLAISNTFGSDSLTRSNYITVKMLPPIADFTADATEVVEGETISFTNMSKNNPETFSWFFEGGSPLQSAQENPVVLFSKAGTYSVRLKVANEGGESMELKEDYITVTPKTAITEQNTADNITIYPNPTAEQLRIENGELKIENVEIFDVMGRIVFDHFGKGTKQFSSFGVAEVVIDISHLPTGVYFVHIQTENGMITKKMVKN